jgi:hypothetical protein
MIAFTTGISLPLALGIVGIALWRQTATVEQLSGFLGVILTPLGVIFGYYYGRRSGSRP